MNTQSKVKLIAVDMDGTFLSDNKTFNQQRFIKQLSVMKAQGVRFVVASGNQYYKLCTYFAGIERESIAYVAENGGFVHNGRETIFVAEMANETLKRVYDFLTNLQAVTAIICGEQSAYVLPTADPAQVKQARNHYQNLQRVGCYRYINDKIIKIALKMEPQIHNKVLAMAKQALGDVLTSVTSGHEWMDLILPGIHKAYGLQLLQQQWGIFDAEIAAFGDSDNDIEMLQKAGYSFAMKNADVHIHKIARYMAPENNDEGVLDMIDRLLKR